jgi:hypothetical protein
MPPVAAAAATAAAGAFATAGITAGATTAATLAGAGVASGAVISSSLAAAGAAMFSLQTLATVVGAAGFGAWTTALQMALSPKASPAPPSTVVAQAVPTANVIYGRARVGGALAIYHRGESGDATRDLLVVWALACHEIDGVEIIYDGDRVLWTEAGGVASGYTGSISYVGFHAGTEDQTADAHLLSKLPTTLAGAVGTDFRLRGHAYVVMHFEKIAKAWTKGLPTLSAVVRGAKVYDPRGAGTAWSANWALCAAHYMTLDRGGAGLVWGDLDEAAVIAAANISDETVATLAGSQARYEINGTFSTAAAPADTLAAMMAQGFGAMIDTGGVFALLPGAYAPPVATITPADMIAPLQRSGAVKMEAMIDGVRATYANPDAQYEMDDAPALLFSDYDPGIGVARYLDLQFERETDAERAQRLALLAGRSTRRMVALSVTVMAGFAGLEAGDRVHVDHPAMGLSAVFEVQAATLTLAPSGPSVKLELLIDDPAYWAWSAGTATEAPAARPSNLPSPATVEPPTGVTLTPTTRIAGDGATIAALLVEWTPSEDFYLRGHEVRWTPAGGAERSIVLGAGASRHEILGEAEGTDLAVEVVAINTLGNESPAAVPSADAAPGPDTTPPGVPTGLAASGGVDRIVLTWINPSDADFAKVLIREGADAVFGASVQIGEAAATRFETSGLLIGAERFFWVAAVDRTGNVSAWAGPVSATVTGVIAGQIADGAVTTAQLANGAAVDYGASYEAAAHGVSGGSVWTTVQTVQVLRDAPGALAIWAQCAFAGGGAPSGEGDIPVPVYYRLRVDGADVPGGAAASDGISGGFSLHTVLESEAAAGLSTVTAELKGIGSLTAGARTLTAIMLKRNALPGLPPAPEAAPSAWITADADPAQVIAEGVETAVAFAPVASEGGTWWSAGDPSALVVPAGVAAVDLRFTYRAAVTISRRDRLKVTLNGAVIAERHTDYQYTAPHLMSLAVPVAEGDVLRVLIFQSTSGASMTPDPLFAHVSLVALEMLA